MQLTTLLNMEVPDYRELEQNIRYTFINRAYLAESLRHRSFVNEQNINKPADNERLEFLGDAVLNLIVGHSLMEHFPKLKEGELSRIRASLVNETQLAEIARTLSLGIYICLGKGELLTQGREKNSILADTFEAVVAAVFLDGGYHSADVMVRRLFEPIFSEVVPPEADQDYKSRLQEAVQTSSRLTPTYSLINESGPDHDKTFEVKLEICDIEAIGYGKTKKTAEQDAARKVLETLKRQQK